MVIVMVDRSLAIAEPRPSSSPCVSRPFLPVAFGSEISTADANVSRDLLWWALIRTYPTRDELRLKSRFSPGRALPGRL